MFALLAGPSIHVIMTDFKVNIYMNDGKVCSLREIGRGKRDFPMDPHSATLLPPKLIGSALSFNLPFIPSLLGIRPSRRWSLGVLGRCVAVIQRSYFNSFSPFLTISRSCFSKSFSNGTAFASFRRAFAFWLARLTGSIDPLFTQSS
jgi:hypothetical protein